MSNFDASKMISEILSTGLAQVDEGGFIFDVSVSTSDHVPRRPMNMEAKDLAVLVNAS